MDSTPIYHLPHDTLHQIFAQLPLCQIIICRSVCKFFNEILSSPSFVLQISTHQQPLNLLALRPPHHHRHATSPHPTLHAFDPDQNQWLRFPLSFLPFYSPQPVAASLGIVYLWADSIDSGKNLVACNPLTQAYRVLPQLGSAWSRHGSVLVGGPGRVLVLTELAALYFSSGSATNWLNFSSNLPSKPRSPILVGDSVLSLCDIGSPWRNQWKLFCCKLSTLQSSQIWYRLEKQEWGDVFDILKRPRLVRGTGNRILMIGGLKSSFSPNASCSTILILSLDLDSLDWQKVGRMPPEMFRFFQESSKFKVFGGGNRICFSSKRVERLALWDFSSENGKEAWQWIDGMPDCGDGLSRGFLFEAQLTALP